MHAPADGWTIDWIGGRLGASPETCAHFSGLVRPLFDLASVTKVAATGTLLAQLFVESQQALAEFFATPVRPLVPELRGGAAAELTLGELWEHRSGLAAHRLLFSEGRTLPLSFAQRKIFSGDREAVWARFLNELSRETLILPKKTVYSDVGMLLLGLWLERKRGVDLSTQFEEWKRSHGLADRVRFRYGAADPSAVPPTEARHPRGQVNDDNAFCMGGVAPHAGLFGDVEDVWAWLAALAQWGEREPRLADEWLSPRPGIERFHAGWDTPSGESALPSQAGRGMPPGTIGHLGYTGTAVWWNFRTRHAGVLLTNRVRPADNVENRALIRQLRQAFFTDLWHNKALGGESWKAVLSAAL